MTTVNEILNFFEEFAPIETAMGFDNCGLLVGDKNKVIDKVLVSLDITNEVVLEAEEMGCQLIISHHPIIFNPLKNLFANSPVYMLAEKNISAVCMHTNLDLSEIFGVNTCLADAIGIKNLRKSVQGECLFIGDFECESIDCLAQTVKRNLECEGLRYNNLKGKIHKVALASGAGGSEVLSAKSAGADVLVTGEIKHHEILMANDLGLGIIDAGHFKTEDVVIAPLCKKLSEKFGDINFIKSKKYNDKIKYM